jgi:D-alanine transaminase
MERYSYVNGEFVLHDNAVVSIEDRGYQFADGVYEVVLVRKGKLIDWNGHYKRLRASLEGLRIEDEHDSEKLQAIITELMQRHQLTDAFVYLQISRGVAPRNHGFPTGKIPTACVLTISPAKFMGLSYYEDGIKLKTCRDLRWKRRDYKTIALLPNVLAKEEALEAGAEEALLIEDNGDVIEGSASNFFWVDKDGVLYTHPANEMILNGITRQSVIALADANEVKVVEKTFTLEEVLENAQEAFITSTTKLVMPVAKIDDHTVGAVGDVTRLLMSAYQNYVENYEE